MGPFSPSLTQPSLPSILAAGLLVNGALIDEETVLSTLREFSDVQIRSGQLQRLIAWRLLICA